MQIKKCGRLHNNLKTMNKHYNLEIKTKDSVYEASDMINDIINDITDQRDFVRRF